MRKISGDRPAGLRALQPRGAVYETIRYISRREGSRSSQALPSPSRRGIAIRFRAEGSISIAALAGRNVQSRGRIKPSAVAAGRLAFPFNLNRILGDAMRDACDGLPAPPRVTTHRPPCPGDSESAAVKISDNLYPADTTNAYIRGKS